MTQIQDWDDAYANMAYCPGTETLPDVWAASAARYRDSGVAISTHAYGPKGRQSFDLIMPEGAPKGLAVFIHGGYWMKFDKSYFSDFAMGARASGYVVCLPSYTLAPDATIAAMTREMGDAITMASSMVEGPIQLAGHSAGGHLATRMVCDNSPLGEDVASRIVHTLSISGVHDLRPLLKTKLNDTLQLDPQSAVQESPALLSPRQGTALTAWVGGDERPEFIRQTQLLANVWTGLGANTTCVIAPAQNHFTVIDGLRDADSPITRAFTGTQ